LVAKSHPDKKLRPALMEAADLGHTVRPTRKGHYQVLHSNGQDIATIGGTASDSRSHKNAISTMRRMGMCVTC
jgi:hypothetical protein